ncbi:hypothetical protein [Streptomyces violaceusniger]|nr:hypothetical protein [Streptomyces violaceusniger]
MGRAMHIRRVRALQDLERTGLITFELYSTEEGYAFTTAAGEPRVVASSEVAAYLAGMTDLYCSLRLNVDEAVGEEALDALDDRYLDALTDCLSRVLPTGGDT